MFLEGLEDLPLYGLGSLFLNEGSKLSSREESSDNKLLKSIGIICYGLELLFDLLSDSDSYLLSFKFIPST